MDSTLRHIRRARWRKQGAAGARPVTRHRRTDTAGARHERGTGVSRMACGRPGPPASCSSFL